MLPHLPYIWLLFHNPSPRTPTHTRNAHIGSLPRASHAVVSAPLRPAVSPSCLRGRAVDPLQTRGLQESLPSW